MRRCNPDGHSVPLEVHPALELKFHHRVLPDLLSLGQCCFDAANSAIPNRFPRGYPSSAPGLGVSVGCSFYGPPPVSVRPCLFFFPFLFPFLLPGVSPITSNRCEWVRRWADPWIRADSIFLQPQEGFPPSTSRWMQRKKKCSAAVGFFFYCFGRGS